MKSRRFRLAWSLEVLRLGLGTIHLTEERGFGYAPTCVVNILWEAVRFGVNFIDTADS